MDKLFKIGQAAKALGVSPSTLRRWERNGKITPERTEGSHRLYVEVATSSDSHPF